MKYRFEECLERGKIVKIPVDPALVEKEREEAAADLMAAEHSLSQNQVKWAIIQGYYSLFHSFEIPGICQRLPGKEPPVPQVCGRGTAGR